MTANVPTLFEVDPETEEALGVVLPFHAASCMDGWYLRIRDPRLAGINPPDALRRFDVGEASTDDFGFDPKCHGCGVALVGTKEPVL